MLKVVASAVVLAILGILYVVYNEHDSAMKAFGWFLVIVGAVVAAVFVYLMIMGEEPEAEPEPRRRRRRPK